MATKNWRHHDFNNLEVQQFTDGPVAFFGLNFSMYICANLICITWTFFLLFLIEMLEFLQNMHKIS